MRSPATRTALARAVTPRTGMTRAVTVLSAAVVAAGLIASPAAAEAGYTGAGYTGAGSLGPAPAGPGPADCVPIGTAQFPPGAPGGASTEGFAALPPAPADLALPASVDLRNADTSFNERWEFALREHRLFTRERLSGPDSWREVPLPGCLTGTLVSISVDDDEMTAVDGNGWVYILDNVLKAPLLWNWTSSFGAPLWLDRGQQMPAGPAGQWALSVHSPQENVVFTDTAGHEQFVGAAKCTMIIALAGDGSRIVYLDPWLPNDHSYEIGGPLGGRFQAQSLSAAGSTTFVMNEYGDMYTRLFDFDISGADTLFFRYSWDDQSGKPAPGNQFDGQLNPNTAAIQLPAPDWVQQPKIPGEITSEISIHSTGRGSDARELRVEGLQDGVSGFWHKMIADDSWAFTPTGSPLVGQPVANSAQDRSADTLAPAAPYAYDVALPARGGATGYRLEVREFNWAASARTATVVAPDGARFAVDLHTVDPLRMTPRGPGLDAIPRNMTGAIGLPDDVWAAHDANPAVAAFADAWLGGRRIAPVAVDVTDTWMTITPQ